MNQRKLFGGLEREALAEDGGEEGDYEPEGGGV